MIALRTIQGFAAGGFGPAAFPQTAFKGRVESFSPASGAQFALLPPDNATGNFTRIVQRIPVKITFDPGQPGLDRLRPGECRRW